MNSFIIDNHTFLKSECFGIEMHLERNVLERCIDDRVLIIFPILKPGVNCDPPSPFHYPHNWSASCRLQSDIS
jgi:hypothetical protein